MSLIDSPDTCKEKKKEILLSPMIKALLKRKIPKTKRQHKNTTQNFDNTTIADRLRTVSWSNDSHPTGVVKPLYSIPTFPLTTHTVLSKGHTSPSKDQYREKHYMNKKIAYIYILIRTYWSIHIVYEEKTEEILPSPMTKPLTPTGTENSRKVTT